MGQEEQLNGNEGQVRLECRAVCGMGAEKQGDCGWSIHPVTCVPVMPGSHALLGQTGASLS